MNVEKKQKPKRHKTIKHSIQYLSATIVAQGIGIFKSILLPILFIPAQLGIWNLMGVIIGYGVNAQLGVLHGMNKMIPLLRGESKLKEIEIVKNSIFWFNFFLGAVAALGLFIASFFVPQKYFSCLCIVAVIVLLQLIFSYLFSLLRANSLFGLLSRGVVVFSIGSTLFILLGAFLFHDRVLGALIGLAIAHVIILVYWFLKLKYRFPMKIEFGTIRRSFVIGIPLIIVGVLDVVFISIDRWIIVANLGVTTLGYYALGIMLNNLISMIPGSVSSTLYPKMLERFAVRKNPADSANMFLGALRLGSMVMLVVICGVSFGVPVFIMAFLLKYSPAIFIIKILILGSFFYSLATIAGVYLISIDKQKWLMVIQSILIVVSLSLYALVLKLKYGIVAVALVTAIVYTFFGISYVSAGVYLVKDKKYRETLSFMGRLIAPFILMILLVMVLGPIIVNDKTLGWYLISSVLVFLLTISTVLPFAWFLNRDSVLEKIVWGELSLIRSSIFAKIRKR